MVNDSLESLFPLLSDAGYSVTSPATPEYNCVAWAMNNDDRWWWPDPMEEYYWPEKASREATLESFNQTFMTFGFEICADEQLEQGYEKVAIFVDGSGDPTHLARQLSNGRWTSKLGSSVDIEHSLQGLTSSEYGSVGQILRRRVSDRTGSK